mmetsp:Transcript_15168/g.32672  ORF Transcript_15168/g.32672 Transcript_15168/m.32672 type:complete len:242 (-) Transcript_15168:33-758(-)
MEPPARHVQVQLADGDAHATGALVSEAEDAAAVGDDNDLGLLVPVVQHLREPPALQGRQVQACEVAEDAAVLLARLSHRRCVQHRQELHDVVQEHLVKQLDVLRVKVLHVDILVEHLLEAANVGDGARGLFIERLHVDGHQAGELVLLAFFKAEASTLCEVLIRHLHGEVHRARFLRHVAVVTVFRELGCRCRCGRVGDRTTRGCSMRKGPLRKKKTCETEAPMNLELVESEVPKTYRVAG